MQTNVKVEFGKVTFGDKITLPLTIKGDLTDEQILILTKLASSGSGFALLSSAQMDIDDLDETHAGIEYRVNGDGTVEVDENQLTLDDVEQEDEENSDDDLPFADEDADDDDDLPI